MAEEESKRGKPSKSWPTDVSLVRLTLMRELETINAYEEFATQATSEDVKIFLTHLANDEKEHVAEATALLRALDGIQDEIFKQDVSVAHMKGGTPHTPLITVAAAPPKPLPLASPPAPRPGMSAPTLSATFTVGSLKGRP